MKWTINVNSSKEVNNNFIIRLDGMVDTLLEIHSAVGYHKALAYGGEKFKKIIKKAIQKGQDITKLHINHSLTCTLYAR